MAGVEAGNVVLAEYKGSGRHFWARVRRVHGSPGNPLCDVEWLRPRAGARGGPLYACESGLDLDETANWDNIAVLKHLRPPTAAEIAEAPLAVRRKKAAGPAIDEFLGESVEAAVPQGSDPTYVDPKQDPVKALQAAMAAAAVEPAGAAQRSGPNVFDVMAPPQAARVAQQATLGYAAMAPAMAPAMGMVPPAGPSMAPQMLRPAGAAPQMPWPAAAAPVPTSGLAYTAPMQAAPRAAKPQQPASAAFADLAAFPGLPSAQPAAASAPPAAPIRTKAAEAPSKAADGSFDFLSGVLSKEMGQKGQVAVRA